MKFLVPNYNCLQNPWLGGYRPQIPFSLSSTEFVESPPPRTNRDDGVYTCHIFKYLHFFKLEGEGSSCKVIYKQVRETVHKGCQYLKHEFQHEKKKKQFVLPIIMLTDISNSQQVLPLTGADCSLSWQERCRSSCHIFHTLILLSAIFVSLLYSSRSSFALGPLTCAEHLSCHNPRSLHTRVSVIGTVPLLFM